MAVTHYTLTAKFTDLLGDAYNPASAKVVAWIETNVASSEGIVDEVANKIAIGGSRQTADSTGLVTWANLVGSDSTPADINLVSGTLQYRVTADYVDAVTRRRKTWVSGWFSLTANIDLADVISETYVPAAWMTTATATLQTYVDSGQAAATAAAASATSAAASASVAATLVTTDLGTTDAQSYALVTDPNSLTGEALTGAFGRGVSVKDPRFGATGDGTTNDSSAIQAAINHINTAGGGEVYFPEGTYRIVTTLTIYSNVTLRGAGREATILKLGNSANTTILRTESFATLTGTNPTTVPYGPGLFTICDMTFDGNKANNTSGWCAQIYGWDFTIERVTFRKGKSGGLYTEWTTGSGPDPADNCEARLTDVKAHQNDGRNIDWNGPHDSIWTNIIANRGTTEGIYVGAQAFGLQVTGLHTWGATQDYGLYVLADGCQFVNTVAEGAVTAQVLYAADTGYIDGIFYAAGSVGYGIQLGIPAGADASNVQVRGRWSSFASAAVNWANDGGACDVDIVVPGGFTVATGTPHAWSTYRYRVPGTGWTTYTPTLTASTTNPTIGTGGFASGAYMIDGKTVHVRVHIQFGSSGALPGSGNYYVSLPKPRYPVAFGGGAGWIYDSSTFDRRLLVLAEGPTDGTVSLIANSAAAVDVTANGPWVWAANDQIRFTLTYEAA